MVSSRPFLVAGASNPKGKALAVEAALPFRSLRILVGRLADRVLALVRGTDFVISVCYYTLLMSNFEA